MEFHRSSSPLLPRKKPAIDPSDKGENRTEETSSEGGPSGLFRLTPVFSGPEEVTDVILEQ